MFKSAFPAIAAVLVAVQSSPGLASVYADDLSKCMVTKTSEDDKFTLMRWMVGMISVSPAVKEIINVTAQDQTRFDVAMGKLVERLLASDCRSELTNALRYEGGSSLEASFGVLGQVAMRGLMNDPAVSAAAEAFVKHIDAAKFEPIAKEAGLPAGALFPQSVK